jgi:diguanylate cyclase (GGDEF)-like protein
MTAPAPPTDVLAPLRSGREAFKVFHEIARALTSSVEPKAVLEVIMTQLERLIRPDEWTLLVEVDDGEALQVELAVGPRAGELVGQRIERASRPTAPAMLAFSRREAVRGQFFSSEVVSLGAPGLYAPRRVLALPLVIEGRALGVIELIDAAEETLAPETLEALGAVADYAAIAIRNARQVQRIRELAVIDEHTGLRNARRMREALEAALARGQRYRHPLTLLFLDIDRFKRVNDEHGHLAGTAALRELAGRLAASIRKVDGAYRYGGDEFVVLLHETPREAAEVVRARLAGAVADTPFLAELGLAVPLTASFGVASFPEDGATADALLEAADRAMFADKARLAGRGDAR